MRITPKHRMIIQWILKMSVIGKLPNSNCLAVTVVSKKLKNLIYYFCHLVTSLSILIKSVLKRIVKTCSKTLCNQNFLFIKNNIFFINIKKGIYIYIFDVHYISSDCILKIT